MKTLKNGFLFGIGLLLSFIITGFIYIYGFSSLSTVSSGSPLTASTFNSILSRVNNIFFDTGTNSLEINGALKIGNSSVCNSTMVGALRNNGTHIQVCDGSIWTNVIYFSYGTEGNPGLSCYNIKQVLVSSENGFYWIKPGGNPAVKVWCDMINGGRTFVARISSSDRIHMGTTEGGTLISTSQSAGWKLSDSDIAAISKNTGYKVVCGASNLIAPSSCNFIANVAAAGTCIVSPGTSNANRGGIQNYNLAGSLIYGQVSGGSFGCASQADNGGSWGTSGQLRVK